MRAPTAKQLRGAEEFSSRLLHTITELRANPHVPIDPTFKQWSFLLDDHLETLFGGAAGPGKSVGLLAAALMYVDRPGYHALLLRRAFPDLQQAGGLIPMSHDWLDGLPGVHFARGREWQFPSGATVMFGHFGHEEAKLQYQGGEYQFIGFDELTQFTESQYLYLFSRLRRSKHHAQDVPLRMRSSTNPGGPGHNWVKARFVDPRTATDPSRQFIPAKLEDNPHLNVTEYLESLAKLDPVIRMQYRHGDWEIRPSGNFYDLTQLARADVPLPPPSIANARPIVRLRSWDLASTEGGGDYTVGVRLAYSTATRRWRIEDVVRGQWGPTKLDQILRATAERDTRSVPILIEQEGGSSGKLAYRDLRTRVLAGFAVRSVLPTGPKEERAKLSAALIANGDVDMDIAPWNEAFVDELTGFGGESSAHDDQVDATAQAFHDLSRQIGGNAQLGIPTGSRSAVPQSGIASRRIVR